MSNLKRMNHFKPIALALLSAVLFLVSWHQNFGIIFLSVAFVPLLILEDIIDSKKLNNAYILSFYAFVTLKSPNA